MLSHQGEEEGNEMCCKMGERKGATPSRARTAWGLGKQVGAFWVREDTSVGWVKRREFISLDLLISSEKCFSVEFIFLVLFDVCSSSLILREEFLCLLISEN